MQTLSKMIGKRIQLQRKLRAMTQSDIGKILGVTLQQVQKYESGTSKISAEKLVILSEALRLPFSYWLEEDISPAHLNDTIAARQDFEALAESYRTIAKPAHRKLLQEVAAALAGY